MIYQNIEAERARRGFSKEAIAGEIGISVKTYYNWLNGVNPIPSTYLIKMADIFGVSIDYLLGRKENRALKNFTDKARKAVDDGEVV